MLKWRSVLWLRSIQGSIHFISPIEKRKRTRPEVLEISVQPQIREQRQGDIQAQS